MGTHLRVLIKSYLMNTNMTGFRRFSCLHPCALDDSSLSIGTVKTIIELLLLPMIPFPVNEVLFFTRRSDSELFITRTYSLSGFIGYLESWSAYQDYKRKNNHPDKPLLIANLQTG